MVLVLFGIAVCLLALIYLVMKMEQVGKRIEQIERVCRQVGWTTQALNGLWRNEQRGRLAFKEGAPLCDVCGSVAEFSRPGCERNGHPPVNLCWSHIEDLGA